LILGPPFFNDRALTDGSQQRTREIADETPVPWSSLAIGVGRVECYQHTTQPNYGKRSAAASRFLFPNYNTSLEMDYNSLPAKYKWRIGFLENFLLGCGADVIPQTI
jgi:hypothetical protein